MLTSLSALVLVACFLGHVISVMGDFSCLCSYSVEVPIRASADESSAAIGFLYEFDCKPVYTPLISDSPWTPIAFSHQVGYVLQAAEQMVQTCPGTPSTDDIVTTTTATMTNISTSTSSSTNTSSSTPKSTISNSSPTTTSTTMSNNSSASMSTTTAASTISGSTQLQFSSNAKTTTEVLQSRTPAVNPANTTTPLPYSTMTHNTTYGSITETKPFVLSTNTHHSGIQETTSTTVAAASKETKLSVLEMKTTASVSSGTSIMSSTATEEKRNEETIPTPTTETLTLSSTITTVETLSTASATTYTTYLLTDSAFTTTIDTITKSTALLSSTDATIANPIVATDTPSTASTMTTIPTTEAKPTTEAQTPQTQMPKRCSDAVKFHAETYHGATLFQGSTCLELVTYSSDWESAENNCATRGGHLVDILSQSDEDMVVSFLHSNHVTGNVWIGLNDRADENTFVWSSGHPLTYKHWISGINGALNVPFAHIVHDCVALVPDYTVAFISRHIGEWDDFSCSENHPYICRFEHKTYQEVIVG